MFVRFILSALALASLTACVSGPVVHQDEKPAYYYGGGGDRSGGNGGGSAPSGAESLGESQASSGETDPGETNGPEGTNTNDGTGAGFGSFSG